MLEPATDLVNWLRLTLVPGVGGETQRKLLKAFGLPQAIFSASLSSLLSVVGPALAEKLLNHECQAEIDAALAWATQPGQHILCLADAAYPQALLDTADPPSVLYAKGDLDLLARPALAIVGSRNATRQGELNAEAFASTLSTSGVVIVSGLALGIDAAAHSGGLAGMNERGGGTIAVIGTGIDRIYPARNAALARSIAEKGLILSEFPLGTPALAANFPRRNRIIAGLALGCLVVEAAERSGSLITARLASEAGREVFAIPGSIHSTLAKGCHQLIRQGAKLVESAEDIMEELRWEHEIKNPKESLPEAEGIEAEILSFMGDTPCDADTLANRCGLTADALLAMLLPLELDGRIACLPGGRYQKLN